MICRAGLPPDSAAQALVSGYGPDVLWRDVMHAAVRVRDGLWWVENGQIRHPVRNLRFNQSVLAMLAPWNVEAIGAPRRLSPFMVPALRLGAFTFTSISDAI